MLTAEEIDGELKARKICNGAHCWSLCPDKDTVSAPSLSVSSAGSNKELLLPLVKFRKMDINTCLNVCWI